MHRAVAVAVTATAALALLATSNAFAGGPPGMTPVVVAPKQDEPVENYAIQTLVSDTVTLGLVIAASRHNIDSETAGTYGRLGLTTFLVGPPIIHLCHARGGAMLASLGMRVATVALTVAAVSDDDGGGGGAFGVLVVGALVSSLVDATVLARGDDPPPPPKRTSRSMWQPTIGASHQALSLGVAGSF